MSEQGACWHLESRRRVNERGEKKRAERLFGCVSMLKSRLCRRRKLQTATARRESGQNLFYPLLSFNKTTRTSSGSCFTFRNRQKETNLIARPTRPQRKHKINGGKTISKWTKSEQVSKLCSRPAVVLSLNSQQSGNCCPSVDVVISAVLSGWTFASSKSRATKTALKSCLHSGRVFARVWLKSVAHCGSPRGGDAHPASVGSHEHVIGPFWM